MQGGARGKPGRRSVDIAHTAPLDDVRDTTDAGGPRRARLGQYELLEEIGRGGMGTVFLARDVRLARRVAIKFLADSSPGFTERFLSEARATARCSHENIVIIHEVDEIEGQPYMVLEHLEGRPLRRLVGDPMPASRAVELIVPVVRALRHAHGFGIVHRDLKPENIFVTDDGQVKVLDFGIAKLFSADDAESVTPSSPVELNGDASGAQTQHSALVGTLPYMSPEQWGADDVDHRTDIWSVGVVLYEVLAGQHPLAPVTRERLLEHVCRLDTPMPPLNDVVPDVPGDLERVVERCLAKRKVDRFADADELLEALEPLLPRKRSNASDSVRPYPGLTAFHKQDAELFFGRDAEIARMMARLRDRALTGIVGASGAGKSSFVRAGLIPRLEQTDRWETAVTRPGRLPLASLAAAGLAMTSTARGRGDDIEAADLAERLRDEPGAFGQHLRTFSRERGARVLLYVDQFEELYTLVTDENTRSAYLACLLGAADDPSSPIRVVVSIRSDFLDRAAEDAAFLEALTPGLMFLAPPTPDALRAALVEPAHCVGYRFESDDIVDDIVAELAGTAGALPLLQFAADQLWDERDSDRRLLTDAAYQRIGGITGALAAHADAVVASLAPPAQLLARRVFERVVTPERTRDIVERSELCELVDDHSAVRRVIDHLVDARLLVVRGDSEESAAVELVHESLIERWPTLQRWLEQNQEDAAFLARLRGVAKQWHESGRPDGLLWRAEAMTDARRWRDQYRGPLGRREREYLSATFRFADRSTRIRRWSVAGVIGVLVALVIAAAIALVWIRDAEKNARDEAEHAKQETERARAATDKLAKEERRQAELVETLQREKKARERARTVADEATEEVKTSRAELERTNVELRRALSRAEKESERAQLESERARTEAKAAEAARQAAEKAQARAEELARKERERADEIEKHRGKIVTDLDTD